MVRPMNVRRTKADLLREAEALRDHLVEARELSALRADRLRDEVSRNEALRSDKGRLALCAILSLTLNAVLVFVLMF